MKEFSFQSFIIFAFLNKPHLAGLKLYSMNKYRLAFYLLFLLTGFLTITTTAQKCRVKIYPDLKRQVIRSIGGNYCQANYSGHAWDAIGEANLQEFRPSHVRVALPLKLNKKDYKEYSGSNFTKEP